jgi:hypothetical protein
VRGEDDSRGERRVGEKEEGREGEKGAISP